MKRMCMFGLVLALPALCFLGIGCGGGGDSSGTSVVASETWEGSFGDGVGEALFTLVKASDGAITAEGEWNYGSTVCPFVNARVTMSGTSFSFTATGTARTGSTTSGFTTTVNGTTSGGQARGTYSTTFAAPGWSQRGSPNWTATRVSGSGITNYENPTSPEANSPRSGAWTGQDISFTVSGDSASLINMSITIGASYAVGGCSGDYRSTINVSTIPIINATVGPTTIALGRGGSLTLSGTFTDATTATIDASWQMFVDGCNVLHASSRTYTASR
jgi:hypothetical protein